MQRSFKLWNLALLAVAALSAAAPVSSQTPPQGAPDPKDLVIRACQAAGGIDAFRTLGIVHMIRDREEVTLAGEIVRGQNLVVFSAPGPIPGRLELPQKSIVSGDDGTGGWSLQGGRYDQRQSTTYMIKRLITTEVFTLLLPFSLTWDGVEVVRADAVDLGGTPAWRLDVTTNRSFFHTPQIPTTWTVYLHRQSHAVLQAECPPIDLGKGMRSDGMRFRWSKPIKLGGVWLPGQQTVVAVDITGLEKSHTRTDRMSYRLLPESESQRLFGNPVPPEQRPKPQQFQPPPGKLPVPRS